MSESSFANTPMWLCEPLPKEVAGSLDRLSRSDDVAHMAVMPDVHLARDICIGTVIATRQMVYPGAVGSDIGCGMAAVAFDGEANLLADERIAGLILRGLYERVPSNRHASGELPSELTEARLSDGALERAKQRDGRVQLGTLGRGNHFVELQADAEGRLWLMLHSGSRGMGQVISRHHLRHAAQSRSGLPILDAETAEGKAYLDDVAWALRYAEANRLAMMNAVAGVLFDVLAIDIDETTLIHSNHNHVRRETHFGEEFLVHRKGALPAESGEAGVIPGSMGSRSFHVEGRGNEASLRSSSHGAGRVLSRSEARRQIRAREFDKQMGGVWFDQRRAHQLRDEAPGAYKDIGKVMRAQRDLTRITRELRPVLSYKGV